MGVHEGATIGIALLLVTSLFGGGVAAVTESSESGPSADMIVDAETVETNERVGFLANVKSSDARVTDLDWEFDDGTSATGWWAAHEFSEPGEYNVSLTATDKNGGNDTATVTITVLGDADELVQENSDTDESTDVPDSKSTDDTVSEFEHPTWEENEVYRNGDLVVWNGAIWEAQWWTQGDTPADHRVWEHIEDVDTEPVDDSDEAGETDEIVSESEHPTWEENQVYRNGDLVVWNGATWEAQWWTQGDLPEDHRVWEQIEDSDGADETGDSDGADETEDSDGADETEDSDGADETEDSDGADETEDSDDPGSQTNERDTVQTDDDMRVVGYYTSWSVYDRNYMPSDVPLDKVTHLNYAFMDVEPDGTVVYGDAGADPENLDTFQELQSEHPDTTMQLSIGGWSLSTHFSDAAATQENRERFAETSVELMQRHGFDGIDIDWEFPDGGGAAGNSERPEDPENFVLLLEEVRNELNEAEQQDGQEYELSIAAAADQQKTAQLDVPGISDHVDYVSVMNYDFTGTWSSNTNHNSKLYSASDDPDPAQFNGDAGMQGWSDAGMPNEKLVYGAAFFGWGFEGVPDQNDGLYQSFTGPADVGWTIADGATDYRTVEELVANDPSYERYWDDEAKVPYVYSAQDNVFITYEDPESIAIKAEYVQENDYGGIMFWEFYGDRDETLIDTIGESFNE